MPPGTIEATQNWSRWGLAALLPLFLVAFGRPWAVAGIVLSAVAVIAIVLIGGRRARNSILLADTVPLVIGQPFSGAVEADFATLPDHDFWLVLQCNTFDGETWRLDHQDELTIRPQAVERTSSTVRIPFAFEAPLGGKPSDTNVQWSLDISSRGYEAHFKLTAVRPDAHATAADDSSRLFASTRDSLRR